MKIAIIGTGNLGKSIAKGILAHGAVTELYLTKRNLDDIRHFDTDSRVHLTTDNTVAMQAADNIIFAVQPAHFEATLNQLKTMSATDKCIISTVTGFSLAAITAVVGTDWPVVRAMPNTAASIGASMTCLSGNHKGLPAMDTAQRIFESIGHTMRIPEERMQAATVICASGIAFWMRMVRATTQGAIQLGFEAEDAQALAMHTCQGAAQLLISSGNHPEEEIDRVTTPMGCTIAGLNEMEHQGLSSSLIQGIIASYQKITDFKKA